MLDQKKVDVGLRNTMEVDYNLKLSIMLFRKQNFIRFFISVRGFIDRFFLFLYFPGKDDDDIADERSQHTRVY